MMNLRITNFESMITRLYINNHKSVLHFFALLSLSL